MPLRAYDLDTLAGRVGGRPASLDSHSDARGPRGDEPRYAPEPPTTERQAAVAAILRAPEDPAADAEILLVRRAEREGDPWSGHMALPGGRRDPSDPHLLATAVRETLEEVNLDLEAHGTLLARLPDVPAIARGLRVGMVIAPFVFTVRGAPELQLSEELVEAIWTPIGPLARGERDGSMPYVLEGRSLTLPCFHVGERIVWGLTHRMLTLLFDALHRVSDG